ncbi:MAG TPA: hypothetical protein VJX68_10820 [Candidatus Binatus sp.]|uniref:hypothetical protein n=1 Tax=Candidatus Binatus sp. TaxID=2811406 RepID=UPI002B48D673|nr:hypothetical protein [Candidatus Binatus sp.]HKN13673.1 hypothetical protein [Candidatus Binatus sp.]
MPSKDHSNEPPQAAEAAPTSSKPAGSDADWPRLLARVVEGIVTAELHEFEDNVMAFLDSAVADAYATFVWICARVIGAAFLLTGLVLFLGIFLQWWAVFGLVGVVVIAAGALARLRRRRRERRPRR